MSNYLDPDQDQPSLGHDLGPNCFQRLSADDKSPLARTELKVNMHIFSDIHKKFTCNMER